MCPDDEMNTSPQDRTPDPGSTAEPGVPDSSRQTPPAFFNVRPSNPLEGPPSGGPSGETAESRPPARSLKEREVKVVNVFQAEERSEYTFVLLQDGRGRKLPIWIGQPEAVAIYIALQKEPQDFHRPLTHDLLKNVVEKLGGRIDRLTIDDMWQDTFYARLVLQVGDQWMDIDCRPSDGIAVALRARAPIYVAEEVLDACKIAEE
jgi:uncharacterized protein